MKVCPTPGHPWLVGPGQPCPKGCAAKAVRSASRRRRAEQGQQHYDTAAWQRTRTSYRTRHPLCRCGAPTNDVDHVVPRRILVAAGVTNADDDAWLQPLCHSCHSSKTAAVDKPLLRRLDDGEDPAALAELALKGWG